MQATSKRESGNAAPQLGHVVFAGVVAALLAMTALGVEINPYDGGISPSSGTFVSRGLVPYRDFWLLYGPLAGYLMAAVNAVVAPDVMAVKILGVILLAMQASAGTLLISFRSRSLLVPVLAGAASAGPAAFIGLEVSSWTCAVTCALVALWVGTTSRSRRWDVAAGILLAVTTGFRLDVGAYAAIALLIVMRRPWQLIAFGLAAAPVAAALLIAVPLPALFEQLIWYPIVGPRVYRAIGSPVKPAPDPFAAVVVLGYLWGSRVAILVGAIAAQRLRYPASSALVIFAALCQLQTLGRGDIYHITQAGFVAFLCLAIVMVPSIASGGLVARSRAALVTGVCLFLAALSGIRPTPTGYEAALMRAAQYVEERTSSEEPIFVGLTENRYTFSNPLLAYYLAGRPPGTRYTMYNPGVTNRDDVQTVMTRELEASHTRFAILDRSAAQTCEPENASCIPGSEVLDEYLRANFGLVADFGDIVIAERRATVTGRRLVAGEADRTSVR